jgi:hypothetical protein
LPIFSISVPAASTSTFSITVFVAGVGLLPILVKVARTSTLLPGCMKPDTPMTLSTLTAIARLEGLMTAAMPPASAVLGASWDSKIGSFALTG